MAQEINPVEYDLPITPYYKGCVLNAYTLTRTGIWWTTILLIRDPKTQKPFIALYRWQKTKDGWKTRKRFTFKRREEVTQAFAVIQDYAKKLD